MLWWFAYNDEEDKVYFQQGDEEDCPLDDIQATKRHKNVLKELEEIAHKFVMDYDP